MVACGVPARAIARSTMRLRRAAIQCSFETFRRDHPLENMMATGTVKWFNPTKGYGFIQPQGGGKDVFVHISAVERAGLSTLNEGQQVEYEIVTNRGKSSAENLKVR
jgi:CspA family cold shock protein